MAADDGLDDIKAQTPAVPILGAGFIQLMEAVKQQRQLVGGNGFAAVGNAHIELGSAGSDFHTQIAPFGAELHRIVQKVVDYLCDIVRTCPGIGRMAGEIHIYIEIFRVDFLLKGDQHLAGQLL